MTDEAAIVIVLSQADVTHVGCGGVAEFVPPAGDQSAFVRCQRCGGRLAVSDLTTENEAVE